MDKIEDVENIIDAYIESEKQHLSVVSKYTIGDIFRHEFRNCRDFTDRQRIAGELIELVMEMQADVNEEIDSKRIQA